MKTRLLFSLLISFLSFLNLNAQQIVHYWHFNDASGELAEVYADYYNGDEPSYIVYQKIDENGDDIGIMDDVAGSDVNARNGYEAGRGIRPRNPSFNGELLITLNSEGFQNLTLSYAVQRSGSGMLKQVLFYTTDGVNFEQFGDTVYVETDFELASFDFSAVEEANDNPNFAVKLRFYEQNVASNGNNRLDNVVLEGDIYSTPSIIHYWHFNDASGELAEVYADYYNGDEPSYIVYQKIDENGDDIGIMDDVAGSDVNARNGYEAGRGIRPRNPSFNGELLITLNSEGFQNLTLSYAVQRSGSGMLKQVLFYTIDGVNFEQFGDTVYVETDFELASFDFSAVEEVNDNPNFAVKLRFYEQNVASNGNNRLDNVVLEGNSLGGAVESVVLNESHLVLTPDETFQLIATVLPISASNQNVAWTSDDETIASVSENGLVTAISTGSTNIVVTTEDGGFEAICIIEVVAPFTIEIVVTSDGTPLENAEVTFDGEIGYTDPMGSVSFERIAGNYSISISASGYVGISDNIEITEDATFTFSLSEFSTGLIHYWHFNDLIPGSVPGNIVEADYSITPGDKPNISLGFLPEYVENTIDPAYLDDFTPGSDLNLQMGVDAGAALRVRNRMDQRTLLIELPTTDCEDIILSFDVHRSGSGMLINHFEYSPDGGNTWFNDNISPASITVTETYTTHAIDLTNVVAANNNPDFILRVYYEGNTQQGNGNNRYDNIAMFAKTGLSLSAESTQLTKQLSIFPNPSNGHFNVEITEQLIGSIYSIYDLSGRVIKNGMFNDSLNTINLESLNKGLYLLIVVDNNGEISQNKLMVR
jgi:hypothetical protein